MRWPDDLHGWPHASASRRVTCKPHRWHVQEMGRGPTVLLLHGAGGASHSWRGLMPLLAQDHHVVALDLPGHGLTQLGSRTRSSLSAIAEDLLALMDQEGWRPTVVIGHSAGGAIALRLAQLAPDRITRVIGLNAALDNFKGPAGIIFPIMAKMLAITPFIPDFFAGSASQSGRVEAILKSTGSDIGEEGIALYRRLVGDRDHVNGALLMMAQWSLNALLDGMRTTMADVLLITGERDGTVAPATSAKVAAQLPNADWYNLPGLGHLMHEEAPDDILTRIRDWTALSLEPQT